MAQETGAMVSTALVTSARQQSSTAMGRFPACNTRAMNEKEGITVNSCLITMAGRRRIAFSQECIEHTCRF